MKVHFTRPLHLGKDYFLAGDQEVPEETLKQPMLAKHIKLGHIIDVGQKPRKVVPLNNEERAMALLEKINGKQKINATPEEAAALSGGVSSPAAAAEDSASTKGKKK